MLVFIFCWLFGRMIQSSTLWRSYPAEFLVALVDMIALSCNVYTCFLVVLLIGRIVLSEYAQRVLDSCAGLISMVISCWMSVVILNDGNLRAAVPFCMKKEQLQLWVEWHFLLDLEYNVVARSVAQHTFLGLSGMV